MGVELEADGVFDPAGETHAQVGLLFHDVFSGHYGISLCCLNYSIEIGFGQTPHIAARRGLEQKGTFLILFT
jgi:hypothetical protein